MNSIFACRSRLRCRPGFAFLFAIGWAFMSTHTETSGEQPGEADARPSWSLVIHGGAGGDPSDWNEEKRSLRREGLRHALQAGRDVLDGGGDAIDAVEQAIRVMENDAVFNAGRGAVLTTEGRAELDASIMNGRSAACGAVAGVTRPKNPISLARRVMEQTPHVLLSGSGADRFAEEQGLPLVDPDYFLSRVNPQRNRDVTPSLDPPESHLGTVGCVALDRAGNLAAGTSTGGTSKKLPGRIGDSPIVGAGTYAANGFAAVSGTGRGEEYIRYAVAYDVIAQMRYADRSLEDAVTNIIRDRLRPGDGGLIAIGADGTVVMQHNTPGMSCATADSKGRTEIRLQLPGGGIPEAR